MKCSCNVCSVNLEFEPPMLGQRITCPNCGGDTLLHKPPEPQLISEPALPPRIPPSERASYRLEKDIFLDEGDILVTKTRLVVNTQTFALAGITSVKGIEVPPKRSGPVIMCVLGGLICAPAETLFLLIGLPLFIGGLVQLFYQKPDFAVVLTTASGEVTAHKSENKLFIERVIHAITEAIISRG